MYSAGQKYRWLIFSGRTRFSALLVAQQKPRDSAAGLWSLERAVRGKYKRDWVLVRRITTLIHFTRALFYLPGIQLLV